MNQWFKLTLTDKNSLMVFADTLNKHLFNGDSSKVYFKIFTLKDKNLKNKVFYIADEGNSIIAKLRKDFNLSIENPPKQSLLTKVAGASKDQKWMFTKD